MSPLDTLVRQELEAIADSAPAPTGLAEQVIRGRRRRRIRWSAIVSAIAVAATAAAAVMVPAGSSGPSVHLNVVYAMLSRDGGWQILDPTTGRYRDVNVSGVSMPTADLRYAAVRPLEADPGDPQQEPDRRIGRYESATGEIRWYDVPVIPEFPAISPDGRHAVVLGEGRLVMVDLARGTVESADRPDALQGSGYNQPVWRPDSRHFMVRNHVFDLDGRVVEVQPVPAGAMVLAARPDRPGLLIRGPDNRQNLLQGPEPWFGVTDERGRLVRQSGDMRPSCPRCSNFLVGYWSARPDEILMPAANRENAWWIYATDLDGGETEPASMQLVHQIGPGVSDFIIAPLADPSDAPGAETF